MLILFDLSLLVDKAKLRDSMRQGVAALMTRCYGASHERWLAAYDAVRKDWASYFADLNFSDDNGLTHQREGYFRVTRGLFRIANIPEPDTQAIHQLAVQLQTQVIHDDCILPIAREIVTNEQHQYGVMTYALSGFAENIVFAANLRDTFSVIIGMDTVEQFERNRNYFLKIPLLAKTASSNCMVVDEHQSVIDAAQSVGMQGHTLQNIEAFEGAT